MTKIMENTSQNIAELFGRLSKIDCSAHAEQKNGLTYLTWAWAWPIFKKECPDATYEVKKFNGLPYVCDPAVGLMVYTSVTAAGVTHEMWLPVMDEKNKAMRLEPYSYKVWNNKQQCYVDKWVDAVDMFDVNKTIMRCLVKNLAMFGLGLYIYAGEDLPEGDQPQQQQQPAQQPAAQRRAEIRQVATQASTPGYKPMGIEAYWQVVKNYALGVPSKSGEDYRTAWMRQTGAGRMELERFDHDVENVRAANGINNQS